MSESDNTKFSNKTIFFFRLCIIFCAVFFMGSILFLFQNIQDLLIDLGDKVLGRALDRENWYIVITKRAKCSIAFSLLIGIAFYLLTIIKFSNNSEARLTFSPENDFVHEKKFFTILVLLFVLLSSLRFFWISQKKTFHIDEIYEFGIINRNEHGFWHGDFFETNKAYSGKEIKEEAFFNDNSLKDTLSDVIHLYLHCNDNPHTGLYYILQRLAFTGRKTFNLKEIVYRSFLVNFIIFAFSFYFMFLLLSKILNEKFLIILILLAAFGNPNTIGNCLFFRPFILQELNMIIFAYVFVFYFLALENNQTYISKKNFIFSSICMGFALISEYFSLFFVGLLGLVIILNCFQKRRTDEILYFITMFFAGILVAKIIYPDYGIGFFDDRAPSSMSENLIAGIKTSVYLINKYFLNFYIFATLLICNVIYLISSKITLKEKSQISYHTWIISVALIFIFIVNYFAPFKYEVRYTAPVFVYLPLILIPFVKIKGKIKNIVIRSFQTLIILFIITTSLPVSKNGKNIPHLDDAQHTITQVNYNKDSSIPAIILLPYSEWAIYPYLNDNQTYYFAESNDEIETISSGLNKYWLVHYIDEEGKERSIDEKLINRN